MFFCRFSFFFSCRVCCSVLSAPFSGLPGQTLIFNDIFFDYIAFFFRFDKCLFHDLLDRIGSGVHHILGQVRIVGIAFFQPHDDIVVVNEVHDRREGDGQQDSDHADETASDDDGNQDPDSGHAEALAEESGFQNVSVKGLQHRREEKEPQRVPGIDQHQDEGAQHGADHGSEGRGQIGHTDDHRDDRHIIHVHDQHEDPVEDTDDQTVQNVVGDILDQDVVAPAPERSRVAEDLIRQNRAEQADEAALEALVVQRQIDGQNERNDPVEDLGAQTVGDVDDLVDIFRKDPGDRLKQLITGRNELRQVNIISGRETAQLKHEALKRVDIAIQVLCEHDDAVDHLRNKGHHEDHEKQDHCEV